MVPSLKKNKTTTTKSAGQTDFTIFLKFIRELRLPRSGLATDLRRPGTCRERRDLCTFVYFQET